MGTGAEIPFDTLIEYLDEESERWQQWFAQQSPNVLEVTIGVDDLATVRDLILHISLVELRYAERLLGDPITPYERFQTASLDALLDVGRGARMKITSFLAGATENDLNDTLTFETKRAGTQSASKRKLIAHALLHSVRHWAQIATALRQHGFPQNWGHDFLFTEAMK
ncbi:MAG: DinB family protein [Acidobacteria bacterium]|nr:DinB family protein [Acidobacteriota bacterium]